MRLCETLLVTVRGRPTRLNQCAVDTQIRVIAWEIEIIRVLVVLTVSDRSSPVHSLVRENSNQRVPRHDLQVVVQELAAEQYIEFTWATAQEACAGVTANVTALLARPATDTATAPVTAAAGTGAVMLVWLQLIGCAATPLKGSALAP